jgi:hypothetical protein
MPSQVNAHDPASGAPKSSHEPDETSSARGRPQTIRLEEDRWATARHFVESVAIVAAGAWAFYTFFYQNMIKPAKDPPALHEILKITRLGRDEKREFIDASFGFQNAGKTEINIAADAWNVWGVRYGTRARVQTIDISPIRKAALREYQDSVPIVSQHLIARLIDLRQSAEGGRPANIVLEPGDETTIHDVIVLPRGTYDLIKSEMIAVPVKTAEFGGNTGRRVRIEVIRQEDGSIFLEPHTKGVFEDDNLTNFALTP